jgi:hypothetical protein
MLIVNDNWMGMAALTLEMETVESQVPVGLVKDLGFFFRPKP